MDSEQVLQMLRQELLQTKEALLQPHQQKKKLDNFTRTGYSNELTW